MALMPQRAAVSTSAMWYQKPASPVKVTTGRSGQAHFAPSPAGKRPAEMAGAAHVALRRAGEVVHAAHPHAGMAGVDHDDGVVGHVAGEFGADALGPDRHGVGGQRGMVLGVPFLADALRLLDPGLALAGAGAIGERQHARQRDLGVAVDARPRADSCGRAPPDRCRSAPPACRSSAPPRNAWSCRRSRCR